MGFSHYGVGIFGRGMIDNCIYLCYDNIDLIQLHESEVLSESMSATFSKRES